ncbi:MAG: chemotaxis protein CheA [Agathobacter sp.]|nr:chemotaxis protein CheA [Agathobacter sp.]
MADGFNTEDMLDMYLFENQQLLEKLQETVLEQKDEECFDEDAINEIFRTMHTIKGSSGIMMFDDITAVSHKLEDIFYVLRESHPDNVPHLQLVEHVLEVSDFITSELEKIENGEAADGDSSEIIARLDKFLKQIKGEKDTEEKKEAKKDTSAQKFYIAPVASNSSKYFRIKITYNEGVNLVNVHAYKAVYALKEIAEDLIYSPEDIISDESSAEQILENGFDILLQTQAKEADIREIIKEGYDVKRVDVLECTEAEYKRGFDDEEETPIIMIDLDSSVEEIEAKAERTQEQIMEEAKSKALVPGDFVIQSKEPGKAKKLAKDKPKKSEKATFINVDVAKMDQLMDLIGELVISQSVVLQNPDLKVPGLSLDNFNKSAAQMVKISTDLQNVIMSMRMVPLTNTFQKMNRIVFDVSRKLGKDTEFVTVGETTEVDKNIVEHISDPLMHLVRNSVDHGIEMPEDRAAAGKTERARVTLSAKTESGKVWITVEDNGKGLDRQQILNKARNQGLLDYSKPESAYTDKEVYQFITLPGFSTKEKVTEYSGRGVGMDVVLSNIASIGGSLEIESEKGKGSKMILKIPLTLAIIDGIVMRVGDTSFVIETGVVKEFVSVTEDMMIHDPDHREFVMIRGECYPVLRVGDRYHLTGYQTEVEKGMMVIMEVDGQHVCLFVDSLVGKQEIVVKPIPTYVKKVKGLSGCTQLGDGSIALILDGAGLVD